MKTINDVIGYNADGFPPRWIEKKSFRDSAIDDIKGLYKERDIDNQVINDTEGECPSNFELGKVQGKIDYIKEKFNITENDLE